MSTDRTGIMQLIKTFDRFLRPYYLAMLGLITLNMIAGVLISLRPLLLAPVLGQVLPGDVLPATGISDLSLNNVGVSILSWIGVSRDNIEYTFLLCGMVYLLLTVVIAGINTIANFASVKIRMNVLGCMISHLHKHLMTLSLGYFVRRRMGGMASRFTQDLVVSARSMEIIVRGCVQSLAQIIVYALILFRTDTLMSISVTAIGLMHLIVTRLMGDWNKKLALRAYDAISALTAALHESFQGIRIIKTFAIENYEAHRVDVVSGAMQQNMRRYQIARYIETPVRFIVDGAVVVAAIYLSYFALSDGRLSVAGIALFFYMAGQLIMPISELAQNILSLSNTQGTMSRVIECLNTKPEISDGPLGQIALNTAIEFRNVSFAYNDNNGAVLRDICLDVPCGQVVAIVGPSGSGKSTLLDLVLRLYDPSSGSVCVDGMDIREINQKSYRNLFGMVSQECLLFNASIKDNIILGRQYDEDSLRNASRIANIGGFIESLPEKYETHVGDRGVRLSGGQRQRIAIARALYGNPKILVFDEATSSLDSESEKEVQDAIERALSGVTGVIVAHRLSTIMHAHKVVVLDKGVIEAVGTHQELLESSATYRRLYNIQFGARPAYEDEEASVINDLKGDMEPDIIE